MAAVEAQTKSLGDSLAALSRRLDDIAGTSASAAKQAAAAQSAAQAAKTASDNANQANQQNVQKSDLDALANRVAALESTVKGLADVASHPAASGDDQAARLTVAAQALQTAIARGAPYQAELAAVKTLGAEQNSTAPLEPFAASGVPSAAALADELGRLVPALQRATETSSGATTILGRLEANARHLIRITPVEAPAGNAPVGCCRPDRGRRVARRHPRRAQRHRRAAGFRQASRRRSGSTRPKRAKLRCRRAGKSPPMPWRL